MNGVAVRQVFADSAIAKEDVKWNEKSHIEIL